MLWRGSGSRRRPGRSRRADPRCTRGGCGRQGGVRVGVSDAVTAVLVRAAGRPAQGFVSAAVGDATELLDSDVDQFPGPSPFVAVNGLTGGPVRYGENGQAMTSQDPAGGGGGDAGTDRRPQRVDAVFAPRTDDLLSTATGVRRGWWCGRLERSSISSGNQAPPGLWVRTTRPGCPPRCGPGCRAGRTGAPFAGVPRGRSTGPPAACPRGSRPRRP